MGKRFLMRDFTIGARLKGLRADAGLTQRQVADDLGIPVSTYSNYENDNRYPAPDMLERICEFFRVSSDYLLGYDPNNVGDRVRKCRHNAGLTQQQLADRSGVSLDVVKRMELCDERISKKSVEKGSRRAWRDGGLSAVPNHEPRPNRGKSNAGPGSAKPRPRAQRHR